MSEVDKQYQSATQLHQAGRLGEARKAYETVLGQQSDHVDSLHYLGILMCQMGQPSVGAELIQKAIHLRPYIALFHNNLGTAFKNCRRLDDAAAAYRRSIELNPNDPLTHSNLGNVLRDQGKAPDAADACRYALKLNPDFAEAYTNLGNALADQGLLEEAVSAYRRAVELRPNLAEAYNNLGNSLLNLKRYDEAANACNQAIQLHPSFAQAFVNLGTALQHQNKWSEAIAAYRRGFEIQPESIEAIVNLTNALSNRALVEDARAILDRVNHADPRVAKANMNLGYAYACQGLPDQALHCYRRAFMLNPAQALDHSFLVYSTGLCPAFTARQILEEASAWANHHAKPFYSEIRPHDNDRSPDRVLKIGYVSPDYRDHVLGWFMPPILAGHDRTRFEVHCFSSAKQPDEWTAKLRRMADHWHDVADLSDHDLAELIRRERIDILVDQAVHCLDNRLLTFARAPAPVQVSYLAYFGTTGLATMDYLLCDPYLELMGDEGKHSFSERIVRLPTTYWCYRPQSFAPAVDALPSITNGHITFGCLNNYGKVNPTVWEVWCRILKRVPGSRLIVHAGSGQTLVQVTRRISNLLTAAEIDPNRVEFITRQTVPAYLATYQRIDIALDPFPYTGGATTCDALWMGVPVVSLVGKTSVSRGGMSLLSNIGLSELVAQSQDEYVKIAVDLASDRPRLKAIHDTLRQRMQNSPLMDEKKYIADLESAYRIMWERWCGKHVSDLERAGQMMFAGHLDDAADAARRAVAQDPTSAQALLILANVYKRQGLLDQSIPVLREIVKVDPTAAAFHSGLVFDVGLHPDYTAQQIFHEAREWGRLHADPLAALIQPHLNDRSPDRKLKIGYVSGDFSSHPVGRFLVPIMSHHDRQNFEIHCFANVTKPDNFTPVFRQAADRWHDMVGLTDDAAAELIRDQQIDILIDLSLHTADNRLLVFARKPAPVQATYLAYCGTSGLKTIDYLVCDSYLIPPTDDVRNYSETPLRLPSSYWCYRMFNGSPDVAPLPVLSAGHITFGCFNNFFKVMPRAIEAWSELMLRIPGSKLVLHASTGMHRDRLYEHFKKAGIDPSRVSFFQRTEKIGDYLRHYQSIDIALDTFPFPGGTTTCDALSMGVPVITLAGQTSVSRGGCSILSTVGLSELVANTVDQYIQLAFDLASDIPRLKALHDSLRHRIQSSPLMDEKRFVADLESAYRQIWKRWSMESSDAKCR